MLWSIIRKARNHCQDVDNCGDEDHCQYHLGIDHCQTGNHCQDREHCQNGNVHADVHADDQDQWSTLKYSYCSYHDHKLAILIILAHEYIHNVE